MIEEKYSEKEILGFIRNFHGSEEVFLNGCCYWFATILLNRFRGEGSIHYNPIDNHFSWKYDGIYYDVSGQCDKDSKENEGKWYPWEYYRHKFPFESFRIELDCILKNDNSVPFSVQSKSAIKNERR